MGTKHKKNFLSSFARKLKLKPIADDHNAKKVQKLHQKKKRRTLQEKNKLSRFIDDKTYQSTNRKKSSISKLSKSYLGDTMGQNSNLCPKINFDQNFPNP